ncbi:MAG: response regulator [Ktedonobacterales bacterium]
MDAHAQRATAPSVLVVDDNADIRETVRMTLEDEGYRVLEAEDGQEALRQLRDSATPLIVLLDHIMPGVDGMKTLDIVAADPMLARRNAYIMLTADGRTGAVELISAGTDWTVPVLAKPFDLEDLLAAVAHAQDSLIGASCVQTGE